MSRKPSMTKLTGFWKVVGVLLIVAGTSEAFIANGVGRRFGGRLLGMVSREVEETSAVTSILDDPPENGINMLDSKGWDKFDDMVATIVTQHRFRKGMKKHNLSRTCELILSRSGVLDPIQISPEGDVTAVLGEQKRRFMEHTNLTRTQHDQAAQILNYVGNNCAKTQDAATLAIAWNKVKEWGVTLRISCMGAYLYTFSLQREFWDLAEEVATCHDLLFSPNENTVTLRINMMIERGDLKSAEKLLDSFPGSEQTRLRTYAPIMSHYCRSSLAGPAIALLPRMCSSPGVHLDSETYVELISMLALNGYFSKDAEPIEGSIESGYSASRGPRLLDDIVGMMADDILEITSESAEKIYNSFLMGFPGKIQDEARGLKGNELAVESTAAGPEEVVVGRVALDARSGICPRTGAKQRLFKLGGSQRRQVHDTLLEMARIEYRVFMERLREEKGKHFKIPNADADYPVKELATFSNWLATREGEPFTAILDGPNIGYHGKKWFNYDQIAMVVDQLEAMNERPLVILSFKYVHEYFTREGHPQGAIRDSLIRSGKLYTVSRYCLDDYYWMLASTVNQTRMPVDEEWVVPPGNADGRYPGLRPMIISNDNMRDHKLALFESRNFRRWKSCHIVNFQVTPSENNVTFNAAEFFSREIQGNPSAGTSWHFPVTNWDYNERFCIRLPSNF